MTIQSASFVTSSSSIDQCPDKRIPEYAFIGRSNVGKSSLINMLTGQKKLAKTSGTPGKTQLINHFLINETWHLVDLPGYGYAKTSKSTKRAFQKLITSYFMERKQLINAFVLVDSRHTPQKIDLEFMTWLGRHHVPFSIIFTKIDKLKPKALEKQLDQYLSILGKTWNPTPPYFVTSSQYNKGKEDVLNYIEDIQNNLE